MQNNQKIQIIVQPRENSRSYLYDYHAHIEVNGKEHPFGKGGGIDLDLKIAKLKATCEAIERYAGSVIPDQTYIKSSYNEMKNEAINPERLINFEASQYTKTFPFSRFYPDTKFDWVKAFSTTENKDIFIPASAVFLGYNAIIPKKVRLFPTTSNGLALGISEKDAFRRGVYELIERDAALILWYTQRIPILVDLDSVSNPDLQLIRNKILDEGLNLNVCISTFDIPIPSTIAIISDKNGYPAFSVGLGCDNDLEKAVFKATMEALMVRNTLELLPKDVRINIKRTGVRKFIDHTLYYSLPSREKAIKNLYSGRKLTVDEINSKFRFSKKYSDFNTLVNLFIRKKMEIIQHDLTTKLISDMGYSVVKTIIPELQPMDVSYKARFLGSKRLTHLVSSKETNLYPHPFG